MRMSLSGPRFLESAGVERMVKDGVERLQAIPGVEVASATCCVPLEGGYGLPFVIAGRPLEGTAHGGGGWLTISPGYFDVFKIPVKRGRAFTERDTRNAPPVVIINEAMAQQFWPKGDPLNDRLIIGRNVMREFADEPERQIIGVVGNVRDGGLEQRSAADDVHRAGAGAGCRQRAERAADADRLGRPDAGSSRTRSARRSRRRCARRAACRCPTSAR